MEVSDLRRCLRDRHGEALQQLLHLHAVDWVTRHENGVIRLTYSGIQRMQTSLPTISSTSGRRGR